MAQLIAAIGVIVSLFYLAAQIRQNTRSMRAMVVDSLAESIADLIPPMAEDRDLMRAFHVVVEDWQQSDRRRPDAGSALILLYVQAFREWVAALADSETRKALLGSEP